MKSEGYGRKPSFKVLSQRSLGGNYKKSQNPQSG
jgi:hypothetical protein